MPDPSQKPPLPPIRPKVERPRLIDLNEMGLLREQVTTAWETLDLLQSSQSQAPSPALTTEIPVSSPLDAQITPKQPGSPTTEFALPEQLQSVHGDQNFEVLANAMKVPRYLIEVLNDFDKIAPGATVYEARPAIVSQIITAQNAKTGGSYPFCLNDDANIPEKGSPCVLKKDHRGRHKDNDDGSWA